MVEELIGLQLNDFFAVLLRFTAKHVSPRLCADEMEQLQVSSTLSKSENLSVKVRSSAREVVATYTLEEFSIELTIILPPNYPVGTATVECGKRLGVATSEWRKWMLQLTTFLTYQVSHGCMSSYGRPWLLIIFYGDFSMI